MDGGHHHRFQVVDSFGNGLILCGAVVVLLIFGAIAL